MTDNSGLIKRLLEWDGIMTAVPPGTLMKSAADALEAADKEIERLRAVLMTESEKRDLLAKQHYRDRIEKLEAVVDAAENLLSMGIGVKALKDALAKLKEST